MLVEFRFPQIEAGVQHIPDDVPTDGNMPENMEIMRREDLMNLQGAEARKHKQNAKRRSMTAALLKSVSCVSSGFL